MTVQIEADNLSRRVDGEQILEGVSVHIPASEVLAVVGPSGSGKTSFLRLLNRLDEPTEGTVHLNETDYREVSPRELRKRVGLVPQEPALVPGTVFENITMGPRLREEEVDKGQVEKLLDQLGLSGFIDRDVEDLSGGEKQRVSIARTLLNNPDVLLLDEPTSHLDPASEKQVEQLLSGLLRELDLTVVLVTHDREQAERLADRILVLENGRANQIVHDTERARETK